MGDSRKPLYILTPRERAQIRAALQLWADIQKQYPEVRRSTREIFDDGHTYLQLSKRALQSLRDRLTPARKPEQPNPPASRGEL